MDTPIHFLHESDAAAQDSEAAVAANESGAGLPPSSNTGGKFPTEESAQHLAHPYAAITDFLSCSFLFSERQSDITEFFQGLFDAFGPKFGPAVDRHKGLHGYKHSFSLGESSAMFAYGGQAGTGFLTLPGQACFLIDDWQRIIDFVSALPAARITRWDGAVDDHTGAHSVDHAVNAYLRGEFNAGGNTPSCNQHGNWIMPDGSGRTFYVGKRKNGKTLRVYEKGMQLGHLWHPWVRWEVELHNVDRVIPWSVLLEPGKFIVGCYPKALGWVRDEMSRIRTIQRQSQISYDHLVAYACRAYGPLINVMLEVEGNPDGVLARLFRSGTPRRLRHPFVDDFSDVIEPADIERNDRG